MPIRVVTTSLSIARELWRYGEPELASAASRLSIDDVVRAGRRMGQLIETGEADRLWPDGPRNKAYLLAAIECVEGKPRPTGRSRRLPERQLPPEMQATHEQRIAALKPVQARLDELR